jgi:hypothetical protein
MPYPNIGRTDSNVADGQQHLPLEDQKLTAGHVVPTQQQHQKYIQLKQVIDRKL